MTTEHDLGFLESAPHRVSISRIVCAAPEQVWAVVSDHSTWTEWFVPTLRSAAAPSEPGWGFGSTRRVQMTTGMRVDERFIAWDEPRLWAFTATAVRPALFSGLVECVRIEPDGAVSMVTYTMAFAANWWSRPMMPVVRRSAARGLTKALANLEPVAITR